MLRILVVDDNVDAADTLALMLTLHGHEAHACHSGSAALARLDSGPAPDLMFIDLGMPGMDGFALCAAVRARCPAPLPWLVALSGWGDRAIRARTAAAGFRLHLTKPASSESLQALVAECAAERSRIAPATPVTPATPA